MVMEEKLRNLGFIKGNESGSIYLVKQGKYKDWLISTIMHEPNSDKKVIGFVIQHPVHGIWERSTEHELLPYLDDEIFVFFAKHLIDKLDKMDN